MVNRVNEGKMAFMIGRVREGIKDVISQVCGLLTSISSIATSREMRKHQIAVSWKDGTPTVAMSDTRESSITDQEGITSPTKVLVPRLL